MDTFNTDSLGTRNDTIEIFTDGACSGRTKIGGWGAVLKWRGIVREIYGGELDTTNNRMELLAAISALEALKNPSNVALYTDSVYLQKGITEWIYNWMINGWRTSMKKPVVNVDLWIKLDLLRKQHTISWHWLQGHAGHQYNERADQLARSGIKDLTDHES